jgi:ABC-2 type transport system ATP-binding protein
VEFDFQVEEQVISKIENLVSYVNIHDMMWELTLNQIKTCVCSFDFAQNNGLKTLQLNQKNKT